MKFGEILQKLRTDAKMTQLQLATASGLSLGIIRDYEQGRKEPALLSAFKLSKALKVSSEVFRDGWSTTDMKAKKPAAKPAKPKVVKAAKPAKAPKAAKPAKAAKAPKVAKDAKPVKAKVKITPKGKKGKK